MTPKARRDLRDLKAARIKRRDYAGANAIKKTLRMDKLARLQERIHWAVDTFFPLCDGLDLNPEQRTALARWIAERVEKGLPV